MGTKNRFGITHDGYYSPWLTNAISKLKVELGFRPIKSYNDIFNDRSKYYTSILKNAELVRKVRDLVNEENRNLQMLYHQLLSKD